MDEGPRIQEHPGIVFRDGPSGRRAALAAGPDVWEIVAAVRSTGETTENRAIAVIAAELVLTSSQIQLALTYYGAFPREVDAQIDDNERVAREALEAWRARQQLLA